MSIIFLIIFLYYALTFWNFDRQSTDTVWKNTSNSLNRKIVDHAPQFVGKKRKDLCSIFCETNCGHVVTSMNERGGKAQVFSLSKRFPRKDMALSTSGNGSNYSVTVHCGKEMHADVNAAINIRNNCITRVRKSGKAAGNQPYTGKQKTEPVDKTLASKPRLVLKVVDLLPHGGHPQQKDDCPLRWIVDMVLWTAPFDSRYPMASVFFLVLFQSRFLNNDLLHLYRYDDLMNS